jgi:hypothetical protein
MIAIVSSSRTILEEESNVPANWIKQGRVENANLILTFALKQTNLNKLDNLFRSVSGMRCNRITTYNAYFNEILIPNLMGSI